MNSHTFFCIDAKTLRESRARRGGGAPPWPAPPPASGANIS